MAYSPIHRLDLNLVRVFVAVYETASVTLAAERLFVTQPSVSYALARLRELFGDPLFTRTADGMQPTLCAQAAYRHFSEGLARIGDGWESLQTFEAAASQRRFRISMSDIGELAFLPPLMALLHQQAPGVTLEVVAPAMEQIPAQLASGQIDAAVGHLPAIAGVTQSVSLFEEHYVCLLRRAHPLVGEHLSLPDYLAARHAYVAAPASGHHMIEQVLQARGLQRNIALQIPHFTALPTLIAHSDLLATMPSRAAAMLAGYENLRTLPLPMALPALDVRLHWHARRESNAALAWFLGVVRQALGPLR